MATQEKTWNVANRLHSLKDSDKPEVNHIIAGADEIYDDAKGEKQSNINAQADAALADRYTKAETYSKEQLDALITTPDVNYVTVATFADLPQTGEGNTVYRVSSYDGTQVDASKYTLYAWNGTSYQLLAVRSAVGEVFDVSEYNSGATYETLAAALAAVPAGVQRGGMSIKFIHLTPATYSVVKTEGLTEQPTGTEVQEALSIDTGSYTAEQLSGITLPSAVGNNVTYWVAVTVDEVTTYTTWVITYASAESQEYVQYRLMSTAWSTVVADWQGIDSEPTLGSENLVQSGGVYESDEKLGLEIGDNVFNRLIDNGVVLENGAIWGSGGNGANSKRVRVKDAFSTNVKRISVPDGFLVKALYYYTVWTDKNNFEFADYVVINQQTAVLNTTYPYVRALFSKTDDTEEFDSQELLLSLFSANGYVFKGVVEPSTSLPSIKARMFCITATPGTYTNFNNIVVEAGELCVLLNTNGKWTKQSVKTRLHTFTSYAVCLTDGNVAEKKVTAAGDYNKHSFLIFRLNKINTADDVTLNINSTGALPLYYNGSRMSSANCPKYAYSILLIYYNPDTNAYLGYSLTSFSSENNGDGLEKDMAVSQYTLSQKLLNNLKQPISLYSGNIIASSGKFEKNTKRVYTQPLYGYIDIKVKSGYVIVGRTLFDNAGTRISYTNITDSSMQYYCEPWNYCMLNIRNSDDTIDISPNENIIEYCYFETESRPKITDGVGRVNDLIKEMYLSGVDNTKTYYVSSIGKNNGKNNTISLVVSEVESGDIVARYYKSGYEKYPNSFVTLSEYDKSGISGMAVVDWNNLPDGTVYKSDLVLLDSVFSIENWPLLSLKMQSPSKDFEQLAFVANDGVVHTAWNYILKDVTIDGVRYLQFSDDLGDTFTQAENTFGDIVYVHFFSNGTCLFATANKCYYFSDISDISESTLLDYDGSSYVSNCVLDFFQVGQSRNDAMIVGGTEIVAWGNYSLGGDRDPNYIGRVWYSSDYGQTVKCAIKFGTTVISGSTTRVRHTHGVIYNKYNEKFAVITGDYASLCQFIEGEYDPVQDSWTFVKFGKGDEFKFGDVLFRDNFVYLVTDYTISTLERGILRCPYPMLNDYTKYQYVCKIDRSSYSGSLLGFLEDKNGNRLIFPDGLGRGKLWYCKKNFKFTLIPMSERVVLTNVGSPNYNGDVYARKSLGEFPFKLSGNMVNLTKSMRQSGCTDFFVQDMLI